MLVNSALLALAAVSAPALALAQEQPRPPVEKRAVSGSVPAWAILENGGYRPLTNEERWQLYLKEAFASPGVPFRALVPALRRQWSDEPPEWEQGMAGYGRRVADRFARSVLLESYEALGSALLRHEPRYVRCSCTGVLARAGHAIGMNFASYDGNRRLAPNYARMGAILGAQYTGNLWMPQGYRTSSTVARDTGFQLAMGSVFNILREFTPELKRLLRRR